jgi:transposase
MEKKRRRRIWEDEEKRRIVAQARVPGISVSQVARRY